MPRREYSARVYSQVMQEGGEIGGNERTSHDEEQKGTSIARNTEIIIDITSLLI